MLRDSNAVCKNEKSVLAHNSDRYDSGMERKDMGGKGISIGKSHL